MITEALFGDGRVLLPVISWLLTYMLHSTLFLAASWMAARWLIGDRPQLEEALWKTALVGGLLTASLQAATPWQPGAGEWTLAPAPSGSHVSLVAAALSEPDLAAGVKKVRRTSTQIAHRPAAPWALRAAPWILLAWLLGGIASALALGRQGWALRRRLADRTEITEGPVRAMADELCREMGDARGVRLTATDRISVPIALGLLRPEICLPRRGLAALSAAEQRSLLAHELAHLVRRDPAWLLTSAGIAALCFFQPLNRLASRRLRRLSEVLSDDWAVASTGSAASLARCLTEVAGWALERPRFFPTPGIAGGVTELGHRIQRLVDGRSGRGVPARRGRMLLAALAAWGLVGAMAPGWTASPQDAEGPAAPLPRIVSGETPVAPVADARAPLPLDLGANQPISRSWVSVPLVDVLQDLASVRNLNFVIELGVGGTMNVQLEDAPWKTVLDQVLRINNLEMTRDGNVWRIAPSAAMMSEAEDLPSRDDAPAQAAEAVAPGLDRTRDAPPEDGSQDDPPPAPIAPVAPSAPDPEPAQPAPVAPSAPDPGPAQAAPVAPSAPDPEPAQPAPVAPSTPDPGPTIAAPSPTTAADEPAAAPPAEDHITPPVLETPAAPRFPKMAIRLNKRRGAVNLRLKIDETGRVIDAQPVGKKSGFGFEREAIRAVRKSKYMPARRNGEPVATEINVTIHFEHRR